MTQPTTTLNYLVSTNLLHPLSSVRLNNILTHCYFVRIAYVEFYTSESVLMAMSLSG